MSKNFMFTCVQGFGSGFSGWVCKAKASDGDELRSVHLFSSKTRIPSKECIKDLYSGSMSVHVVSCHSNDLKRVQISVATSVIFLDINSWRVSFRLGPHPLIVTKR